MWYVYIDLYKYIGYILGKMQNIQLVFRQFDQYLKTFFKKSLALDIWCVIIAKRSLQITIKQQPE